MRVDGFDIQSATVNHANIRSSYAIHRPEHKHITGSSRFHRFLGECDVTRERFSGMPRVFIRSEYYFSDSVQSTSSQVLEVAAIKGILHSTVGSISLILFFNISLVFDRILKIIILVFESHGARE